jgi:hypothetical protein
VGFLASWVLKISNKINKIGNKNKNNKKQISGLAPERTGGSG